MAEVEPIVALGEAQAFVRIETGEEEAVVAGLIRTASATIGSTSAIRVPPRGS